MKKAICGQCVNWESIEYLEQINLAKRDLKRDDLGICKLDRSQLVILIGDGACACFKEK